MAIMETDNKSEPEEFVQDVNEAVKVTLEINYEIGSKQTIVDILAQVANLKETAAEGGQVTGIAHFGRKKYRI